MPHPRLSTRDAFPPRSSRIRPTMWARSARTAGLAKCCLGKAGIQLLVILQFPFESPHQTVFRGLTKATQVRKSDAISMVLSRSRVFHEITSPAPKQPQLISIPFT